MTYAATRSAVRTAAGRRQAARRRALLCGVRIAIVMLVGSLVVAALLRAAVRVAGAPAVGDPLDLPASAGAASAASTWGYVLFQSALIPHPILGTQLWTWGGGSLVLTALLLAQAFRCGRDLQGATDAVFVFAPSLLVGIAAGVAELAFDRTAAPLELSPLIVALPAVGALLGLSWSRLRHRRAAAPWLRAALPAAFAVPAGIVVAAAPAAVLAPPGGEPGGAWMAALLPFAPNAVVRAGFGPPVQLHTLLTLLAFAVAAMLLALHLRPRSLAERAGFTLVVTVLLVFVAGVSTPDSSPGQALVALARALPGAGLVGLAGGLFGPALGQTAWGHMVTATASLRALGDRLPPPPAPELTARDMEGAQPDTRDQIPVFRPRPRAERVGRAAVATAVAIVLLAVVLVGALTFAGTAPPDPAAPELAAARAYLDAAATNDADRIWPAIEVDTAALPAAAAPRLLARADLGRMLAVSGNQHSAVSAVRLSLVGGAGGAAFVRARYVEAGTEREQALRMAQVAGRWRVVLVPSALAVTGVGRGTVSIDGAPVTMVPGQQAAVLPGVHTVEARYSSPFEPAKVSVVADAAYPGGATASLPPRLDDSLVSGARTAVANALRQCAASNAPRPAHCPQGVESPGGEAVRWTVVGDPAPGVSVTPDLAGGIVAAGVFQMVAGYAVHVPEDVKHVASAGTFRVPLVFAGGEWSVAGDVAADGGTVSRPQVADAALLAAVQAGFRQCTTSHLLRPADCPQTLPSTLFVRDVAWRLDSDPMAGALAGFDARSGILTVSGAFAMTCSYNEGGVNKTAQSSGRYRADLLWDGQRPVLVGIGRA